MRPMFDRSHTVLDHGCFCNFLGIIYKDIVGTNTITKVFFAIIEIHFRIVMKVDLNYT